MYETLLKAKKEIQIVEIEQTRGGKELKVSGRFKTFLPVEKKLVFSTPAGNTEKISFMKHATFQFSCTFNISAMDFHDLTKNVHTVEQLKVKCKEEEFESFEKNVKIDQKLEDQLKRFIPDSPYKAEQKEQFLKICEKIGDFELFKKGFTSELLHVLANEAHLKMIF